MKGDFSRLRFSPRKNYTAVLQQQGRVALDADANEQCAINDYLRDTETVDVVGRRGGPVHDEGFKISVGAGAIHIGRGRYYVDGILCENPEPLAYSCQPYLIDPSPTDAGLINSLTQGSVDVVQVYLEVWRRLVTALDDPCLREPALGQADTTARLQTVWRVVAEGVTPGDNQPEDCCKGMGPREIGPRGKMSVPPNGASGDCSCQPTPAAGYRGLENQLYRVEIHQGGDETAATFKWSRDNGSVVVAVTNVSGCNVYVDCLGFDANLGFSANQWVEISDDADEFGPVPNQPGTLYQIQSITPESLMVTMTEPVVLLDPVQNPRMRRWDQFGSSATSNGVSLSAQPVDLESGIQVEFSAGQYVPGDYWLLPARTATGQVEWPPCDSDGCIFQPPYRNEIFRAPLACIRWDTEHGFKVHDCREKFYPLTELAPLPPLGGCCTRRVGDGKTSFGDFTSIQAAIKSLPDAGGEICILPGRYYEHVRIVNRRDIVIHGCGWQTRVASPSLKPSPAPQAAADTSDAINPIAAVFTIVDSEHIRLRSFAVEAAADEAGILIDGAGTSLSSRQAAELEHVVIRLRGATDIAIEDLVITAATLPAVLAERVQLLRIDRNRVASKNVQSRWSTIYASGTEIHIGRNWIGVQSAADIREWLPSTVAGDLRGVTSGDTPAGATPVVSVSVEEKAAVNREFVDASGLGLTSVTIATHPGGIQIGGPSTDVYIDENQIEGGSRNGITLGSFDLLDAKGDTTGIWVGVSVTAEGGGCCTGTLLTSNTGTEKSGTTVVAGGMLTNIQIHRNRIRNMGLCGIGPAGFFDLRETLEVITTVGLNISGNAITRTLLRDLTGVNERQSTSLGYGAICIPDVEDLVVRDNTITDFGPQPGAEVCGIFILHGEMLEISRNHVIETRDWTKAVTEPRASAYGARGGIVVLLATPPTFRQPLDNALWAYETQTAVVAHDPLSTPIYEPGLPAVRVEHNVVRVPLDYALLIFGLGPFSIVNNHLGCGGLVRSTKIALAQTVLILNMGTAIENATASSKVSGVYDNAQAAYNGPAPAGFRNASSGAVLFSNNLCQLEATASRQREFSSVFIFTPDHLIFSNNHCWLDSPRLSSLADALLLAESLNVVGNRFQEAPNSVALSGLTVGVVNITEQNISTYCLIALGPLCLHSNNLALVEALPDSKSCQESWGDVASQMGQ